MSVGYDRLPGVLFLLARHLGIFGCRQAECNVMLRFWVLIEVRNAYAEILDAYAGRLKYQAKFR